MSFKKIILKTGGLVVTALGLDKNKTMLALKRKRALLVKLTIPGQLFWLKTLLVVLGPRSFHHGILTEYILLLRQEKISSRQFDEALRHYIKVVKF